MISILATTTIMIEFFVIALDYWFDIPKKAHRIFCAIIAILIVLILWDVWNRRVNVEQSVVDEIVNGRGLGIEKLVVNKAVDTNTPLWKRTTTIKDKRSGIDINQRFERNRTLLHYAVLKGNTAVVRKLLELGANPNTQDHSFSAAMDSAGLGNKIVHYGTPLGAAIRDHNYEIVRLLLDSGASTNTGVLIKTFRLLKIPGFVKHKPTLLKIMLLVMKHHRLSRPFCQPIDSEYHIYNLLIEQRDFQTCRIRDNIVRYLTEEHPPGYRKLRILYTHTDPDDPFSIVETIADVLQCSIEELAGLMVVYAKTGIFLPL